MKIEMKKEVFECLEDLSQKQQNFLDLEIWSPVTPNLNS